MNNLALRPVAVAFLAFGVFVGVWAVAAADIERGLGMGHRTFGLLVSGSLAVAALANVLVGPLTDRFGAGPTLASALIVWAMSLGAVAVAHGAALVAAIGAAFAMAGAVDVAMNVAATAALRARPGHLVRFHALFNVGAAVAALATGFLVVRGASWWWCWVLVAAIAVGVARSARRSSVPNDLSDAQPWNPRTAVALIRSQRLVMVAVAFALAALVEGGVSLWGVLYLREHLSSGVLPGATAAAAGFVVAAIARVSLGPLAGSLGTARGIGAGGALAAAGLVVMAVASNVGVAAGGLVLAASGISVCWPLLLAHATAGGRRPGAVVGLVSGIGYLGFVAGPTIVGFVSSAVGLDAGMFVLAGVALLVAVTPLVERRARAAAGPNRRGA